MIRAAFSGVTRLGRLGGRPDRVGRLPALISHIATRISSDFRRDSKAATEVTTPSRRFRANAALESSIDIDEHCSVCRARHKLWTSAWNPAPYRTGTSPEKLVEGHDFDSPMAEWIARVYRVGKQYRVVVEGLLQFDADRLEGVEEKTAKAILGRLRKSYPTRAKPWADPNAERVMEFEVEVRLAGPSPQAQPRIP
jgi:hypothetical protein